MVELRRGNLLDAQADALVKTVNCVGIMGKGVALQFRQAYPENFREYQRACRAGEVRPGHMFITQNPSLVGPRYLINFPTKRHWRDRARIEDIRSGLEALTHDVKRLGIGSIAIPPLGCGSGGLQWSEVRPLIEGALAALPDVRVLLYEPTGAPDAEAMPVRTEKPRLTRARAMLLRLLEIYGSQGYRASRLEIQKLAYFLQAAGEPLRLAFAKEKYGPYAETLNHVLQRLEGHFIRGYGDRSAHASIHLLPGAADAARGHLRDEIGAEVVVDRVARLIDAFETSYGMELLATVHWIATTLADAEADPARLVSEVHRWSPRKRHAFQPEHILRSWRRLKEEGWLRDPARLDAVGASSGS